MKKIIVFILSFFLLLPSLFAVSSDDVSYAVNNILVDAQIEKNGDLTVNEVLKISGTYNGYIRDLLYKNSKLKAFDSTKESSFENSDIYNASAIELITVGNIEYTNYPLDFDIFNNIVNEFGECSNKKGCYEKTDIINGISIKMYNETISGTTYFYLKYKIKDAVVMHSDLSELYYTFIGEGFDDKIGNAVIRVNLPSETDEEIRVWAHGPLYGDIYPEKNSLNDFYTGAIAKIDNLYSGTPVDVRMTFSSSLLDETITKMTDTEALDKILNVENKRAEDANNKRKRARFMNYLVYVLISIYSLAALVIMVYIYIKYDREYKSEFDNEYNRDFIDEYDVTAIEYLFNKKITERSFTTTILNLVYKKKISVEEIEGKKKDYKFTLLNRDELSRPEEKVVEMLFDRIGNKKEVTISEIKKYSKKINGTSSPFLSAYDSYVKTTTDNAIKEKFFEDTSNVKLFSFFYGFLGVILIVIYLNKSLNFAYGFIIFLLLVVFFIYTLSFRKRTQRGNLHFHKWKAFKKFLLDFGRFDEKELPEITLWERYLVYANIFGLATKVSDTMKVKFPNMVDDVDRDFVFNYVMWHEINRSINSAVYSAVSTARSEVSKAVAASSASSGGGHGGGFSSGGGFGGGGGGGRGF